MDSTQVGDLLQNAEFVRLAKLEVPAKNLLSSFAPDRSIRWLQDVCKTARESVLDLDDAPVLRTSKVAQELERNLELYDLGRDGQEVIPAWAKTLTETKSYKRIPDSTPPLETNWMKLEGDYAIVTDVHVPFHRAETLENLMNDSEKVGVKHLIIGGDLVDGNQWNFRRGTTHQRRAQVDIEECRGVLAGLLEYFETIKIVMGNHDLWLAEHLRNHFDPDFLYGSFFKEFSSRITWSKYGHCDVVSGGVKWKITHGTGFSESNPVGIAKKMAEKFGCNIVVGHQHRVAESFGKYHCICLGGAIDDRKMAYLQHNPTTNEQPKRSYAILKDGWCQHIIERP